MKNLLNKIFFSCIAVVVFSGTQAQTYLHGVQVPKVDKAGYYTVQLPENVYSVANKKRTNLRVFDDSAKEIPYLAFALSNARQKLVQIPVEFKYYTNAAYFDIIIDPKERIDLNQIIFTLSNPVNVDNLSADIFEVQGDWAEEENRNEKTAPAANSWTWKELRSDASLSKGEEGNRFTISYSGAGIRKPTRIVIKGINNNNLLQSATYEALRIDESAMFAADSLKYTITEDEATKSTLIKGSLPYSTFLTLIKLDIANDGFYRREATLSASEKAKKGLFSRRDQGVVQQQLSNNSENSFLFSLRVQEFEIYIHNNDNTPLKINGIKAYSPPAYIMAWLEPGKTYTIKAGEETMRAPNYDLQYNSDIKITDTLVIQTSFMPLQGDEKSSTKTLLLWLTLGLCILVLGGMAFSMIKKEKVVIE